MRRRSFLFAAGKRRRTAGSRRFPAGGRAVGPGRWQARAPQKERTSRIQAYHPVRLRRTRPNPHTFIR